MQPLIRFTAATPALLALIAASPAWPAPPTTSVELRWTAPGDDGQSGNAQAYLLRYSTEPITSANFDRAAQVTRPWRPRPAGSEEHFTVRGLAPNTTYYFALKTMDEAGNRSVLSNVAIYSTETTAVGDFPEALSFSAPWPNPARTSLTCAFALPRPAMVEVDAFSVDGRHVRRLAGGWQPPGRREVTWDLRDASGSRVPAGIYFVRARLDDTVWSERVAIAR